MEMEQILTMTNKAPQLGDNAIAGVKSATYSRDGEQKSSFLTVSYDDNDNEDDNDDDEEEEEENGSPVKRRKYTDDERLVRCRERNRKHARNTRERKKLQMDTLQMKIQQLTDEKLRLKNYASEESVASILISLTGRSLSSSMETIAADSDITTNASSKNYSYCNDDFIPYSAREETSKTMEAIRNNVAAMLSDDEELEIPQAFLNGTDKAACSASDMEMIRRERNRMHAKKTRLRKKKMLQEMENIISRLQEEIRGIKKAFISNGNGNLLREGNTAVSVASAREMEDNYMEYKQELQITSPFGPYGNIVVPTKVSRSAPVNTAQMNGYPTRDISSCPDPVINGLLSLSDRKVSFESRRGGKDSGGDTDSGGDSSSRTGSDDVLYGSSLSQACKASVINP